MDDLICDEQKLGYTNSTREGVAPRFRQGHLVLALTDYFARETRRDVDGATIA